MKVLLRLMCWGISLDEWHKWDNWWSPQVLTKASEVSETFGFSSPPASKPQNHLCSKYLILVGTGCLLVLSWIYPGDLFRSQISEEASIFSLSSLPIPFSALISPLIICLNCPCAFFCFNSCCSFLWFKIFFSFLRFNFVEIYKTTEGVNQKTMLEMFPQPKHLHERVMS